MINKLKEINEQLIEKYQNDKDNLNKQIIINEILKDNNCFIKMNIETAFNILRDLNISEQDLSKIYIELMKNIQ